MAGVRFVILGGVEGFFDDDLGAVIANKPFHDLSNKCTHVTLLLVRRLRGIVRIRC